MRLRLLLASILVTTCHLILVVPAHAFPVKRPAVSWLRGEGNYTKSHRGPQAIRCIVIHVTEGPFSPSIRWLRSERSHASSHYIVSRNGRIVQLVHQSDIAWHAGNWRVNRESVGVEIAGFVDDPRGFTEAQYRSAARLAAYIARRSLIPIDRRHFIGHADVPNPFVPGARGGSSGHTDPGPYWSWSRYLRLVRKYAFPPKPVRLRVESGTFSDGQRVRGVVSWRARVKGPVRRVEVRVDGRLVLRDRRAPFGGRWDTRPGGDRRRAPACPRDGWPPAHRAPLRRRAPRRPRHGACRSPSPGCRPASPTAATRSRCGSARGTGVRPRRSSP